MSNAQLETAIEAAWDARDTITSATTGETRDAIEDTLAALDSGKLRVAEKMENGDWHVNQWAKKAVLLGFRIKDMEQHDGGPQGSGWWDKVDSKFKGWNDADWKEAGFRAVPNCVVRKSAYIAPGVVLMPSFVNIGAYVDSGTMVDTWATVGSCAQIGKNVHLSVLGMGVYIGQSTKILDRETGEVFYGEVPAGSVVVAGSMPSKNGVHLYCAVIVKRVDEKTRSKTSINELLRD